MALEAEDLTSYFVDSCLPSRDYLDERRGEISTVHIQGIILGAPGSGKSTVGNWLAKQITVKYGSRNVWSIYTEGSLEPLLLALKNRLVNYLFLDDATLAFQSKKTLRSYFRIRHILEERTGRTRGLILTLVGLHRFYAVPVSLRTNFDFLMVRSSPSNPFDRRFVSSFLGKEGLSLIDRLELLRREEPSLEEWTPIWIKYGPKSGLVHTPAPVFKHMREVVLVGRR